MKNFIKFLFFILTIHSYSQEQTANYSIVGEWVLTDYWGNKSDFTLTSDYYVSMTINGEQVDGKNYIIKGGVNDGKKGEIKYTVNYDSEPISLDLVVFADDNEFGRILCAIKPINENECMMTLNFIGHRDTNFDKENAENFVMMKRKHP